MFIWVWCFALIVWLLCACGVRRLYDLWRVCLYFVLFCPLLSSFLSSILSSILSFCSCVCLSFCPLCSCFLCLSSCPLLVLSLSLWVVVSFSPSDYAQKRKDAPCWCVLARPVVCCFIWLLLYIPRTRQVSARLYRNKVLEKGNLTECSKLFCARLYSYLCSSKFVLFLFSYLLPLVGSYFLFPFRLLCCLWNYETIVGGFNSKRVPCYPCNGKEIATMRYYFITVSAFALHHHPTIIVCSCLSGAWLSVCLIKAINVATIVGVNITLCLFGVVVDCFHCFIVLCCLYFLFPFGWVFVLSDHLNKSATYIIFHACHIINRYVIMIKTISGIIEVNKRKI